MKKILTFTTVMLLSIITYAQEPSKQATMDWIAEKMKQHIIEPRVFKSYENGIFTYQKPTPYDDGSYGGYAINIIDLNKVGRFSCNPCEGNYVEILSISGNKIIKTLQYDKYNKYEETEYSNDIAVSSKASNYIIDFSLDYYLGARMYKALNNLQKYNANSGNESY